MNAKNTQNAIPVSRLARIAIGTAAILMIPLVAMQFTSEVQWGLVDFIIIGALLFGAGLVYELLVRNVRSRGRRIAIALAVVAVVLCIWAELAVGVFTNLGS